MKTLEDPFPRPVRLGVVALAVAGLVLIAVGGGWGPGALVGFAMFCAAIAGLDGMHRGGFGFRQLALLLGWFGLGVGLWTLAAAALSSVLDLPVAPELRSLLILAAGCGVGAVASILLLVTMRGRTVGLPRRRPQPRAVGFGSEARSRGAPRPGPQPGAVRRPRPPAGPAPGG